MNLETTQKTIYTFILNDDFSAGFENYETALKVAEKYEEQNNCKIQIVKIETITNYEIVR